MLEFGLAFIVLLMIVAAMSVGVLLGRKPIKGTCGGMAALNMGADCDICGGDASKCDEEQTPEKSSTRGEDQQLGYDGSRTR